MRHGSAASVVPRRPRRPRRWSHVVVWKCRSRRASMSGKCRCRCRFRRRRRRHARLSSPASRVGVVVVTCRRRSQTRPTLVLLTSTLPLVSVSSRVLGTPETHADRLERRVVEMTRPRRAVTRRHVTSRAGAMNDERRCGERRCDAMSGDAMMDSGGGSFGSGYHSSPNKIRHAPPRARTAHASVAHRRHDPTSCAAWMVLETPQFRKSLFSQAPMTALNAPLPVPPARTDDS
jgi:hypothetical protein